MNEIPFSDASKAGYGQELQGPRQPRRRSAEAPRRAGNTVVVDPPHFKAKLIVPIALSVYLLGSSINPIRCRISETHYLFYLKEKETSGLGIRDLWDSVKLSNMERKVGYTLSDFTTRTTLRQKFRRP